MSKTYQSALENGHLISFVFRLKLKNES